MKAQDRDKPTHRENCDDAMEDRSWDALIQLLAEYAIDTGIPDLARQHDHYLYGSTKRPTDPEVSG